MAIPTIELTPETKFNAGVDIALNISKLIKEAEYFASIGNYPMWHIKLEAVERRMWSKFREKEEAKNEVEKIKREAGGNFRRYLIKHDKNKKISNVLADNIKLFLSDYEKSLIFWRDKFGYGMPLKDDSRFVLG
jgi:hypothetical protein|tara:strand:- start:1742 stop:2143 length:402 start_codon:yes stop_codon:yes gene_type:complete